MKKHNNFFLFFLLFLLCVKNSIAAENISFIDIDFLIKNSNAGKRLFKDINEINNNNIDILEKKNSNLIKLDNSIKNKKNIISENDFDNEVKNFQKKIQSFTNEKNEMVKKFNNYKKNELDKLFSQLRPIISKYMQENNVNILLDSKNIFMGSELFNVTEDVLKIVNEKIK